MSETATAPVTNEERSAYAEAQLNAALARAQAEFPPIDREKTVRVDTRAGGYTFSYAELGTILAKVRPVLSKHGLSIVQPLGGDLVPLEVVRTELRHTDGGKITAAWPISRPPERPQELGSLLTYLRRYAIVAMLGIATEEDDDGGQAAKSTNGERPFVEGEPEAEDSSSLTEAQRKKLFAIRDKLNKAGVMTNALWDEQLHDWYGTDRIGQLTSEQASELIGNLETAGY